MPSDFEDLHDELRAVATDLLAKEGAVGATVPWPLLVDAGWVGLDAPDDVGGAGATFAEVAVVLDSMGRAATAGAYLGAGVLGVGLLTALQPRPTLLREVVAGEAVAVAVLPGDGGPHRPASFTCDSTPGGLSVTGRAEFVLDAVMAHHLLLVVDNGGTPVVVTLPSDTPGVTITPQPVLDHTRVLGTVTVDGVSAPEESIAQFDGDAAAGLQRLWDRAHLAIACDSLGISEAMLKATVDYVGLRHQFGRAIGSFQAVKHTLADMLVEISVARQLVAHGVDAVVNDHPDASRAVAKAKAYTSDLAVAVAGSAMQLHGGIGYTWESGIHVYLKRATLNRSLFGSPAEHRRWLAQLYA